MTWRSSILTGCQDDLQPVFHILASCLWQHVGRLHSQQCLRTLNFPDFDKRPQTSSDFNSRKSETHETNKNKNIWLFIDRGKWSIIANLMMFYVIYAKTEISGAAVVSLVFSLMGEFGCHLRYKQLVCENHSHHVSLIKLQIWLIKVRHNLRLCCIADHGTNETCREAPEQGTFPLERRRRAQRLWERSSRSALKIVNLQKNIWD